MSTSIRIVVSGNEQVSQDDLRNIKSRIREFNESPEIVELIKRGDGSLFVVEEAETSADTLLKAEVRLPHLLFDEDIDDFIYVAEHWINLISVLRKIVKTTATWKVSLGNQEFIWDAKKQKYLLPGRIG